MGLRKWIVSWTVCAALATPSSTLALTSTYSGGSCRGYPRPADVTRLQGDGLSEVTGSTFGLMCPIARLSGTSITSVSVLTRGSGSCSVHFGSDLEDFEDVYSNEDSSGTGTSEGNYNSLEFNIPYYGSSPYAYIYCDLTVAGYTVEES